jgi:hypothetical protein
MKLLKFAVFTFIILSAISAGVIYYAFSHVNDYVVGIVEQVGSELTQTAVSVDRADINLTKGSGALYNLSIANPAGYSDSKLYVSNKVALSVAVASFSQPVKVIEKVDVRDVYFSVEYKGVKNNLQAVMDTIRSGAADNSASAVVTVQSNGEPIESPIKVTLGRITFSEIQVELSLDDADVHSFVVPGFFIENIGDASEGLSPTVLGKHITLHLMKAVDVAVQKERLLLSQASGQDGAATSKSPQDILGELLQDAAQSDTN